MQRLMDTVKSYVWNWTQGSILDESEDGEKWLEIVEAAKSLYGL